MNVSTGMDFVAILARKNRRCISCANNDTPQAERLVYKTNMRLENKVRLIFG